MTTGKLRIELERIARNIRDNGDRVTDADCIALSDAMWTSEDTLPLKLRQGIGTIWASSKCANGDLIRLSLELLASTLTKAEG